MASPAQIRQLTNHLRLAYGQKGYDEEDERLGYIVDECSHIPAQCLEELRDIFKQENPQKLPILFADALKSSFQEWLRRNPEKRTRIGISNCQDCGGTGLLHFRDPEDFHQVVCFQCICGIFGSKGISTRSRVSLLREGWVEDSVMDFEKYRVQPIVLSRDVVEMPNYEEVVRELNQRSKEEIEVPF